MKVILGPGLAPGLAGFGLLAELERSGQRILEVVGANTGALVAALWAAQSDLELAARVIGHLPWAQLARVDHEAENDALLEALQLLTRRMTFDQAPRRCGVILLQLGDEQAKVVQAGSLAHAVRAALSVPGLIRPLPGNPSAVCLDAGADWTSALTRTPRSDEETPWVWAHYAPTCAERLAWGASSVDFEGMQATRTTAEAFGADARTLAAYVAHSWLAVTPPAQHGSITYTCAGLSEGIHPETNALLAFDRAQEWFAIGRAAARAWLKRRGERKG